MSKYPLVFAVAAGVLLLDQLTKWYIRHSFALYESVTVIDSLFHITHVRNAGGAFGLLNQAARVWRLPFFLAVSCIAVGVLLAFVRRIQPGQRWLLLALGAILGGALGNLVDRMASGEVTDFLDFHWHGYHWPAFNLADSCITAGMVILLLHSLFGHDDAGGHS
ncbi:MAG: signal peptidase II [Candidatus Binatia bacterium]|jgi:signal peptidase II